MGLYNPSYTTLHLPTPSYTMSPPPPEKAYSFLAVCVQTLLTHGPTSITGDQITMLEQLRDGTLDTHLRPKVTKAVAAPDTEKKRKRTKAANASVQLPTGTPLFRTIGDRTFEGAWNNEDRTILWEGNVYPSPTAFCKACYASIHGPEKFHAINGQAACYVLRDGKRVTLEKLRDEAAAAVPEAKS